MMQADLGKVGVNAKLVTYEWGEYRKRIQNGEATAALFVTLLVIARAVGSFTGG